MFLLLQCFDDSLIQVVGCFRHTLSILSFRSLAMFLGKYQANGIVFHFARLYFSVLTGFLFSVVRLLCRRRFDVCSLCTFVLSFRCNVFCVCKRILQMYGSVRKTD